MCQQDMLEVRMASTGVTVQGIVLKHEGMMLLQGQNGQQLAAC